MLLRLDQAVEHPRQPEEATGKTGRTSHTCDNPKCGRKLKRFADGRKRWIRGSDRRITNGKRDPRYCWPGEGCNR